MEQPVFAEVTQSGREHKRRAAQAFDGTAATYGTGGDFHDRFAQRLVELADMGPGQHVLDVATGTAPAAIASAKRVGTTGWVIGVDLSAGILRHAQTHTASLANVWLCQSDAEELPFADGLFDVVLCSSSVVWFPDIPAAFREWKRVLKSDGMAMFSCFAQTANPTSHLLRKHLADYGIALPNLNAPLDTPEKCRALMQQAGFAECDIITEQWGGYIRNDANCIFENAWNGNRSRFGFNLDADPFELLKTAMGREIDASMTAQGFWNDTTAFFVRAM